MTSQLGVPSIECPQGALSACSEALLIVIYDEYLAVSATTTRSLVDSGRVIADTRARS